MRSFLLFVLSAFLFLLSSCKKYQAADPSFFVKASKVSVASTSGEGSGSHKITDLWLYVNGKYQGAYPVGSKMPIPSNDRSVRINLFAGIKNNGISDTRIFYPFFDFLTIDTLVESGKSIERAFTFRYKPATAFAWIEDFDSQVGTTLDNYKSDTIYKFASAQDSYEKKSIELGLTGYPTGVAMLASTNAFALPQSSSNVYMELNYKCNVEFEVGLIGDNQVEKAAFRVNPQPEWNKVYIQLATAINNSPVSTKYKVYFKFYKEQGDFSPKIFLDNIKILYL